MPQGTQGNDTLVGSHELSEYINGMGGDDWIEGGDESSGGDHLGGGDGNDTLLGGAGDDLLYGDGTDPWSGSGDDSLEGGAGSDYLDSRVGNDTLRGGAGNDTLMGAFEQTYYASAPWTAWLYGEDGDDFIQVSVNIRTSPHTVVASGGAGQDRFGFDMEQRTYPKIAVGLVITDFQSGAGGDSIDLLEILESSGIHGRGYEGGNPFDGSLGYLRVVQSGADTLLQYDEDGIAGGAYGWHTAITLQGVDSSSLTAENLDGLPPDGTAVVGQVLVGSANGLVEGTVEDDTITGGGGGALQGHGGNDWIQAGLADSVSGGPGADTLIGSAGDDFLHGQSGNDVLRGRDGADFLRLIEGEGNDTLLGGNGNDTFAIYVGDTSGPQVVRALGGAGDDQFHVGNTDDVGGGETVLVTGGEGQDTYLVSGWKASGLTVTDFTAGVSGDELDVAFLMAQIGYQGVYRETVRHCLRLVQDGANTLLQYDWDGRANGTHWQTAVRLRNVDAGALDESNFTAISATGTVGADTLQGSFGADYLAGGDGDDLLDGLWGGDRMDGGRGNDRYVVDALSDQVQETSGFDGGTDTVVAHVDYTLGLLVENLVLRAGAVVGRGNDLDNSINATAMNVQLHGGGGNDSLAGGDGADTLSGGTGADQLQGGSGLDVFRYTAMADSGVTVGARDVIVDFSRAGGGTTPGDKVDLSAIDAIAGSIANDAFTFIGNAQFSTTDASGQLRFAYVAARACVVLYGSVDADGDAEFAIELAGIGKIAAADLLL